MELAVKELINRIADHIPSTEEVDPVGILNTIRDPSCLILRNPTEEAGEKLEEVDPDADIPSAKDIVQDIEKMGTLNEQQKHDIGEIFENLEIAHKYLGRSCGLMAGLSRKSYIETADTPHENYYQTANTDKHQRRAARRTCGWHFKRRDPTIGRREKS